MTKKKKSPEQKLARVIQTATDKPYTVCLREATAILGSIGEDEERECGDRLQDWVCSLPPGPHPRWRHLDENEGYWWQQSGDFPYSNVVILSPGSADVSPEAASRFPDETLNRMNRRGPSPDLVIIDEAVNICPNCRGPLLEGGEHFTCKAVPAPRGKDQ